MIYLDAIGNHMLRKLKLFWKDQDFCAPHSQTPQHFPHTTLAVVSFFLWRCFVCWRSGWRSRVCWLWMMSVRQGGRLHFVLHIV